MKKPRWEDLFGALGVVLLLFGCYRGLWVTPPDRFMGDVMRILYVHVPAAWTTLLCFTASFVAAIGWSFRRTWRWEWFGEATTHVGLFFGTLLLVTGMTWARPTWGVWWDWDPRLTTVAIMMLAFAGVTALRSFVEDAERRATLAAIAAILAYVDVPIVYFSVKWWRTLHQMQSSPSTVDPEMVLVLRVNAFAYLFLGIWFVARHYRIIRAARQAELRELA